MHALEYFQQIYIINLPQRHDRRREMAEQLKAIGLGFNSPFVRLFEAFRPDDAGGFPTIGARGCFLSHLGVFRDASARGFERILIFEDDLNFVSDFSTRAEEVVAALKREDWSVFYGSYSLKNAPPPEAGKSVVRAQPGDSIQTAHFIGFCGSTIREMKNYLEAVLQREPGDPRGGPMHVDGAYGWFRFEHPERITLIASEQLGYQRSSRTDIHSLRWFDRGPGIRQVMGWLRSQRNKSKRERS